MLNLCLNGIMTRLVETAPASGMEDVEGTRIALKHKMSVRRLVESQVCLPRKIACLGDQGLSDKKMSFFNFFCFVFNSTC